jgi:hypothetical protein
MTNRVSVDKVIPSVVITKKKREIKSSSAHFSMLWVVYNISLPTSKVSKQYELYRKQVPIETSSFGKVQQFQACVRLWLVVMFVVMAKDAIQGRSRIHHPPTNKISRPFTMPTWQSASWK